MTPPPRAPTDKRPASAGQAPRPTYGLNGDWREIGTHVPQGVDRRRLDSPELTLWTAQIADAIAVADAIGRGALPTCISGATTNHATRRIAVVAAETLAWTESSEVGGLIWICEVIAACSSIELQPDLIRASITQAMAPVFGMPSRKRRRISIEVIDR